MKKLQPGIYIHLPFCLSKCHYCAFATQPIKAGDRLLDDYIAGLLREIERRESRLFFEQEQIGSLYFGGGTPSIFTPQQLAKLLKALRRHAQIIDHCEITIEANPEQITRRLLNDWQRLGFNRLSIGIQSTDQAELTLLGRTASRKKVLRALERVAAGPFENFNCDLLSGLPGQSKETLLRSIEQVVSYRPTHISFYDLQWETGTAFQLKRQAGQLSAPNEKTSLALWLGGRRQLKKLGYRPYEISNFCRPHYHSRHNTMYWRDLPYLGLGAGAHSFSQSVGKRFRWANFNDPKQYLRALGRGKKPTQQSEEPSSAQAAFDLITAALRTTAGIDKNFFLNANTGADWPAKTFKNLVKVGLLRCVDSRFILSAKGIVLSNEVFIHFLP